MADDQFSREDIEGVSEKLEAFAATLSDRERDVLATVIQQAGGEEPEVSGFSYSTPLATQMAISTKSIRYTPGISIKTFPSIDYQGEVLMAKPVDHW